MLSPASCSGVAKAPDGVELLAYVATSDATYTIGNRPEYTGKARGKGVPRIPVQAIANQHKSYHSVQDSWRRAYVWVDVPSSKHTFAPRCTRNGCVDGTG